MNLFAVALVAAAHQPHDPMSALDVSPAFASDGLVIGLRYPNQNWRPREVTVSQDGGVNWSNAFPGMTNLALFPILKALGTPSVFLTVQTEGRRPAGPALQVERARHRVRPGAILDLHDADGVRGAGARLAEALPAMIGMLGAGGYSLVPLRDLL